MKLAMNILIFGRHTSTRVKSCRLAIVSILKNLGINEYYNVKTVLPDTLQETNWLDTTKLLIIPGGYNHGEDLQEDSIKNIHKFVECGGSYLAMCAGAYTSCDYSTYRSGNMVVNGRGKINVYPGQGVGSIYHPISFSSSVGSRMVPLFCNDKKTGEMGKLYGLYNGGPAFLHGDDITNCDTLATYTDFPQKKAIIRTEFGKGRVILSGVYPILNIEYLDKSEFTKKQWDDMEMYRGDQQKLWIIFLKYLLNTSEARKEEGGSQTT